jgi:hypothetical protein
VLRLSIAIALAACGTAPYVGPVEVSSAALPISETTSVAVSTGEPMDYDSAFFVDPASGDWVVVFDRFTSPTVLQAELCVARSTDHASFASATVLPGTDVVQGGPSAAVLADGTYLYFMHGPGAGVLHLARAAFDGAGFGPPVDLALDDAGGGFDAWPVAVPWKNGTVALSYNHYGLAQGELASGDGVAFDAPQTLGLGVQGRVATFADGALAFTEQTGVTPQMVYVRVSRDGTTWTSPAAVTTRGNVHDAMPFRRASGGVDLYYISSDVPDQLGFSIFRRSVDESGALGPEQRLSDASAGRLTQPHPHRLADGTIVITFAKQITSNMDTDTYLAHIAADDAPL